MVLIGFKKGQILNLMDIYLQAEAYTGFFSRGGLKVFLSRKGGGLKPPVYCSRGGLSPPPLL